MVIDYFIIGLLIHLTVLCYWILFKKLNVTEIKTKEIRTPWVDPTLETKEFPDMTVTIQKPKIIRKTDLREYEMDVRLKNKQLAD